MRIMLWLIYFGWPIMIGAGIIWFINRIARADHIYIRAGWWAVITLLVLIGVICIYYFVLPIMLS